MHRVGIVVVAAWLAAVPSADRAAAAPHYIVHGTAGPGVAIALKDGLGHPYTGGLAGMFIITVTDRSSRDGFRLLGPGTRVVITGLAFVGKRTIGVTLGPGTYHYRSDAHPHSLNGTFVLKR
jgi:hypothetical protein